LDDGALIANDGQDPPALITKSDGSYMYLTTDIGTILYREKNFCPMKNFAKVAGITLLILITLLRFGSTENGRMKRL